MNIENAKTVKLHENGNLFAYEITPNEGYALKWLDGEEYSYSYGFMIIPLERADSFIDLISAIPIEDIPSREPINTEETEEVSDSEALAELLEVIDNEA